MALNIKNPEAERVARELASETGESLTEAVTAALRERLDSVRRARYSERAHADLADIQAAVAALADRDTRTDDEILGFDQSGLPG